MPLALYRRYRPVTFDEVIGQEHVTTPLKNALLHDRVHHAYLFSGPRGCGKTTSARILARSLNCEQGPTPTPCGTCRSCRDLAADGPGSLDVIEIDAASHGGVDDARDLRETTMFSPASSRFKIYIIDEAHMVSNAGFNALLKIVEEPPEHVKFVFATTEPDKVLGTIRSRTHHYPFHLVPPSTLEAHLAALCELEGVVVEKGVLPLVVRAGAGSVRDALSLLDQLIAGSDAGTVGYSMTAGLLGFTDGALLDDAVEAMAAGDGASLFHLVDRVVEGGHDPRRFAADLLERLRDLIIVDAVPDAARSILRTCPDDAVERMRGQAARFGTASLARAADVVSAGLVEMRGATSPRLHLELICARTLLPAAADTESGVYARMERLERRMGMVTGAPAEASTAASAPAAATVPTAAAAPAAPPVRVPTAPADAAPAPARPPAPAPAPPPPPAPAAPAAPPAASPPPAPGLDLVGVRRMWPEVLEAVKGRRRATWALLSQQAHVLAVEPGRLVLAITTAGQRDALTRSGHDEIVRQALIDVLGVDWAVDAVVDPSTPGAAPAPPSGRPVATSWDAAPVAPASTAPASTPPTATAPASTAPTATGATAAQPGQAAQAPPRDAASAPAGASASGADVPAQEVSGRRRGARPPADDRPPVVAPEDDIPDADDLEAPPEDDVLHGRALLERDLGAKVIDEYDTA